MADRTGAGSAMPALMFTRRLLKALGSRTVCSLFPLQEIAEGHGALGGWSANVLTAWRRRYVLFVNARTLMSVIVPLAPGRTLLSRFKTSLHRELTRLGVREEDAFEEVRALDRAFLAPNDDRSVLGVLNDYALHYRYHIELECGEGREPDLAALQAKLNQMPHVSRGPTFSDRSVRSLFGVDEPRAESGRADEGSRGE